MANLSTLNYGPIILERLNELDNNFNELNRILKRLLEEIKNGKTSMECVCTNKRG